MSQTPRRRRMYFRRFWVVQSSKYCRERELNSIFLCTPCGKKNHRKYLWLRWFLPIFACRGGPGSAARCGGGPRGTQKLIRTFVLLARAFHENIFEAKASRKPCENLAKTLRKPGENLAKTWRKPCESIAKTSRKPRPEKEPRTPSLH